MLLTTLLMSALAPATIAPQDAATPKIVELTPANGAIDVDPTKVREIVVVFDRKMNTGGFSFCGGGDPFPQTRGAASWKDDRTCVLPVDLVYDHDYRMLLNCPAASNFRSAEGAMLVPVRYSFSTAPEHRLSPKEQEKLNRDALRKLVDVLAESYSYYDRKDIEWREHVHEHEPTIVEASSTKAWARAVGSMLEPAEDIHLYLRYRGDTVPTASRAIDPLVRPKMLPNYIGGELEQVGRNGLAGKTEDGIGYVLIGTWSDEGLANAMVQAIRRLAAECSALIVDVRPNSGGSELLAREVAQWFVSGEMVYAKNRYRVRKGKSGFGKVLERRIEGKPDDRRITKPVIVLQSRYVMSSNEAFVLMMRQAPNVVTVGQTTYGSSGNPKPHSLPNGVEIVVPSWQAMRPDGSVFEGEGIAPDIEVEATSDDLKERDPILERALEELRG